MRSGWLTLLEPVCADSYLSLVGKVWNFPYEDNNTCHLSCNISFRELVEVGHSSKDSGRQLFAGNDAKPAIVFPPIVTAQWEEQVQELQ